MIEVNEADCDEQNPLDEFFSATAYAIQALYTTVETSVQDNLAIQSIKLVSQQTKNK